jgi:hypothetical protein
MNRNDLEQRLQRERFRPDAYRLDGSPPANDGFVLGEVHGKWTVSYFERGLTRLLGEFTSEQQACERLYELLKRDSTAKQA